MPTFPLDAVVTVGDGRGYLVSTHTSHRTLVITAAHCLPHLPPPIPGANAHDRTYDNLIGPLGQPPTLAVKCLFVDPVADLAVLDSPDEQNRDAEAEAYERLCEGRPQLHVAAATRRGRAWVLSLDGEWHAITMDVGV